MNEIFQQRLRLYLIRHGELEEAAFAKLLGQTDTPLSDRGLEQARNLAEVLSTERLSAVYSSDLQRARVTAQIIAKSSNLEVKQNTAWREIDMGEWEGRTMSSLHDQEPELVGRLFEDPASFEYPGGESFVAFSARVQGALDELLKSGDNREMVLVAHGGVCRTIIGNVLGMPTQNWLRLAQDYGCLNVIDWHGINPTLRSLNFSNEKQGRLRPDSMRSRG
jgi:alpha-ribazole phosphatase